MTCSSSAGTHSIIERMGVSASAVAEIMCIPIALAVYGILWYWIADTVLYVTQQSSIIIVDLWRISSRGRSVQVTFLFLFYRLLVLLWGERNDETVQRIKPVILWIGR